ncbi:Universal stress protein UspA [Pararobbsia alpina]|uniref:universal stress protein n=1 Tax=Pararobbsia alpina TaxID=621374 RepID=UPI0039A48799
MSYKTIVVHLDTSARAQARLHLAIEIAKRHGAFLQGVFAVFAPNPRSFVVMAGTAEYYEEHETVRHEEHGALERLFEAELSRAHVDGEWIDETGNADDELPKYARRADLLIIGQDDPADPESFVADHFPENMVMSAGRPVLVVPYAGSFAHIGRRVMVAWDGSREATRAVHDALPLLKQSEQTTVVTISAAHGNVPGARPPGADIAATLTRHGVKVTTLDLPAAKDVATGEMLLARIDDIGADLVVMGGYGHTRWQELILGGVTRTMLSSMTVPVLMSH